MREGWMGEGGVPTKSKTDWGGALGDKKLVAAPS